MVVKVVDASAAVAVLFGEPQADMVAARLAGCELVAPALFAFELGNVCLVKCRRDPSQADSLRAAFALASRLGIVETAVDQLAVLQLALETKLTHYDAAYLWLARTQQAELVTLDAALAKAATASATQ